MFSFLVPVSILVLMIVSCKPESTGNRKNVALPNSKLNLSATNLPKVTFLPYWVANAQFAGYYMAVEMGIYKKYGMDVQIIPFQSTDNASEMIKNGKVDFAALWLMNAIGLKASGVDIVDIAQFSHRSSLMLVTKKSSGITELEQMDHKKVGVWMGFELQPRALFKRYHLDVNMVPIGSSNNLFLYDGVEITLANWFDEYHSIINAGFNPEELNMFFFADYGFNFLEDGIYCLSEKSVNDPVRCANFVAATAEGWAMAFADPEKAVDIVIAYAKRANLPINRAHQRWMIDRYKDLYYPGNEFSTTLSIEDYLSAAKILKQSGQIAEVPSFARFYHPFDSSKIIIPSSH